MPGPHHRLLSLASLSLASLAIAAPPPPSAGEGWTDLFNGTDLTGWHATGDIDAWTAANGEIAGLGSGRGGWIQTDKMYRDFELYLEFNVPPDGNSGVGLRGSSVGDPAFTGMEVQILDTHGREPTLTFCGSVYDAIAPTEMAVHEAGQWNAYHIRLVGDTLNVWLNGVHIHQDQVLDDRGFVHTTDRPSPLADRLTTGYISLQDHGDPVRFRSIRIKDLSPDPDPGDFQPLFNGRDLTGFHQRGGGEWVVEGGTLVGRNGPGHLFTDETFENVEFRAFVRVIERGNSGMYFRTVPRPEDPDTWPLGYEAQVDNHDPRNFTGCIYDKAWPGHNEEPITRDEAWFDYRVRAVGSRVQTWINGVPMVDTDLNDFQTGHLAFQTHHRGNEIMYRDLQIRVLDQEGEPVGEDGPVVPATRANEASR
ncbi:MAG: DUF1080 domain-containing protein [Phycisphaerales bacterium]